MFAVIVIIVTVIAFLITPRKVLALGEIPYAMMPVAGVAIIMQFALDRSGGF